MHMEQHNGHKLAGALFYSQEFPLFVNRAEETFDLRYHFHDFVEITYVAEGRGFHHVGEDTVEARQGDLFIVPEGVSHVFRPGSSDRKQRMMVYNAVIGQGLWEMLSPLFAPERGIWNSIFSQGQEEESGGRPESGSTGGSAIANPASPPAPRDWIIIRNHGESLNSLFQELHYEFNSREQGRRAVLLSCAIRLLVLIDRCMKRNGQWEVREADLSGVMDYIRLHYREPLTLAGLAARCGLSERHFFRLFKRRTGQTFSQYVQSVRMEAACKLLRETDISIIEVTEAAGYRDTDSFYRVFKLWTGCTPGEYRKQRD
ncbi:MAG: AraC family transcriptional regulator [Paenibacillaceae bacterium]|nr:AraC family transcriptional regulator [Paenibacillaceae bacterium]